MESEINYFDCLPNEIIIQILEFYGSNNLFELLSISKRIDQIITETNWNGFFIGTSLKNLGKIINLSQFKRYHFIVNKVSTVELVKLDYYRLKHGIKKLISIYERKKKQINIFNVHSNMQIKDIYNPIYERYNIFLMENISESDLNGIVNCFKKPHRECILSSLPNCNIDWYKLKEIAEKTNYYCQPYINLRGYKQISICRFKFIEVRKYCDFSHTDFDDDMIWILTCAKFIDLSYCSNITRSDLWKLVKYRKLILSGCHNIKYLDSNYLRSPYLEDLDISHCPEITIGELRRIKKINISGCTKITTDDLLNLPNRQEIILSDANIKAGINVAELKTLIPNMIVVE